MKVGEGDLDFSGIRCGLRHLLRVCLNRMDAEGLDLALSAVTGKWVWHEG